MNERVGERFSRFILSYNYYQNYSPKNNLNFTFFIQLGNKKIISHEKRMRCIVTSYLIRKGIRAGLAGLALAGPRVKDATRANKDHLYC